MKEVIFTRGEQVVQTSFAEGRWEVLEHTQGRKIPGEDQGSLFGAGRIAQERGR